MNRQVAQELGLNKDHVQSMTRQLREGVVAKKVPRLAGLAEFDELYVVAGHKGHPGVWLPKGAPGEGAGSKVSGAGVLSRRINLRISA